MKRVNRKALRKSVWSSISRLIGIMLGAGAGVMFKQLLGTGAVGLSVALMLAAVSFGFMLFAEYERENG